ncbi:MAG: synthase, partial [Holophagaceae bacterium]|nr:synthase [Holophagaceae bacterium]
FKARAKEITDLLSQAERDKAEGEAQLKELEARMTGLKAELDGVVAKAEADAEAEKQRILEAAKTEASQILAQASADIDAQRRMAEAELRALVAELAVEAATARLKTRIQGEVGEKLLNRAIDQVGGAQ